MQLIGTAGLAAAKSRQAARLVVSKLLIEVAGLSAASYLLRQTATLVVLKLLIEVAGLAAAS